MGLKKQVIQFKDGIEINRYNSAVEAANNNGASKNVISKCCNGKLKEFNGYTFSYSGEYTNKVEKSNDGDYKCPYCDEKFETFNGLTKHVLVYKAHSKEITKEQFLVDFKYGGVRPTCKCGCGEYTDISYANGAHFCDYILGHASRIHNNWGHNETAIMKSTQTRKEQYEKGIRTQWNKGKKWDETYDSKTIEKLYEKIYSKERNKKIQNKLKGVPKSESHAEKCRENGRCEKSILKNREKIRKLLEEGTFSISSEKEKLFIEECIKPLSMSYNTQYYINELHHYCDVFIPEKNTIIEFNGDYWHGNPKKYKKENLTKYQLKKQEKDELLRTFCKDKGIELIEIWESDFDKSKDSIKTFIEETLKGRIK